MKGFSPSPNSVCLLFEFINESFGFPLPPESEVKIHEKADWACLFLKLQDYQMQTGHFQPSNNF